MNFKNLMKKTFSKACFYFTAITAIYAFISTLINSEDGEVLLSAARIVLFFVFSLLLSLANVIASLRSLSDGLKVICHFLITAFAFYSCFLLPLSLTASGYLVGFSCFALIYFAIAGLIYVFKSRLKRNIEKSEGYKEQFKK